MGGKSITEKTDDDVVNTLRTYQHDLNMLQQNNSLEKNKKAQIMQKFLKFHKTKY